MVLSFDLSESLPGGGNFSLQSCRNFRLDALGAEHFAATSDLALMPADFAVRSFDGTDQTLADVFFEAQSQNFARNFQTGRREFALQSQEFLRLLLAA